MRIARQALDVGAAQARQRDHGVGADHPPVAGDERIANDLGGDRFADELDAGAIEQPGERVRGDRSEDVERARFVASRPRSRARPRQLVGGEERELVDRQRPAERRAAATNSARSRAARSAPSTSAGADRPAERRRAGHAVDGVRAGGDDQSVVAAASAVGRAHFVRVRRRRRRASRGGGDAELRETVERDARRRLAAERREHRRRALDEVAGGRQQLDRHAIARERAQREDGLEGGDAAAGDEDAERGR